MQGVAKRLFLGLALCLALTALMAPSLFAAATGKIAGQVKDKDTKEPIPGASVQIKGTKVGTTTDPDGNFQIPRVDPGTYVVVISAVGYNTLEISDAKVSADLTCQVNGAMSKMTTDLKLTITSTANRDIIDKFQTANQTTIDAAAIKNRPVQTVDNLLRQVAGVQTNTAGQVFIRGGRAGEVSYVVDGVPVGDPLGGPGNTGANLSLVSGSIQEIQIIKDGFDPEYGNALAGIVKIQTQTGNKDNTKVNFQFLTDNLGTKQLNTYSQNYDFARFSLSGPDPVLKSRILPALGLNFLQDKEFTYYLYGEVEKGDGNYPINNYNTATTSRQWGGFDLLGINVPDRLSNRYYVMGNLKFRPKPNLNMVLSYKNSQILATDWSGSNSLSQPNWQYLYTTGTLPVYADKWHSLSLEISQELAKNMNYEAVLSYYQKSFDLAPGDPNNPGHGLNPDQFLQDNQWESYTDRNGNGKYDPPEPIINMFPDTANYGNNVNGPGYTYGEYFNETHGQSGTSTPTRFRFNTNGYRDSLEGEPFLDLNGNGIRDGGDFLNDQNGNGKLDASRLSPINQHTPEPYVDGDSIIGEPFTDVNGNGRYDPGIDGFIMSNDPRTNQDLNHNGRHDGPENLSPYQWQPGIPYVDRNGNGVFDPPSGQYQYGDPYTDVNGNGRWDGGGASSFLDPGTYDAEAEWAHRVTKTLRGEVKLFRQMGPHEIKVGGAIEHDDFAYQDIKRGYLQYLGRPDGGPFPDRGAFRDVFNYQPWAGDLYIRDNVEYGSMIALLGLRWDFFLQDVNALVPVVKSDDLGSGTIIGEHSVFSPRIGFSYPISDKAKVHFNYGHFYQQPAYSYMYSRNTVNIDQNDVVGNYNLNYEKTVQYSFGVKYAMSENYSIDLSGYFKDEFDKINQQQVTLFNRVVNQYQNSDYGRDRGFELTLEKRGGGYVNGELSYTYAFAYGKASQTSENYLTDFELSRAPLDESPLNDDIRHSLKAGIQIYIPTSVKPRLFGLPIPNGWALSIQSVIESGRPFTPSANYPNLATTSGESIGTNSLRLPGTAVFDVRFNKDFKFVGLDYSFIIWVQNIFNARNVVNVSSATGRADTQQNINGTVFGGTAFDQNPYNWDYPRQVRVGLEINL